MSNKIVFVNGKSKCGCVMAFSDGARSYTKPANPYALQTTGKTPLCRNPA